MKKLTTIMHKLALLLISIFFLLSGSVLAAIDSEGKVFYLGFAKNYRSNGDLSVYISSQYNASGTVTIDDLNFIQSFSVESGSVTEIKLPSVAQVSESGVISKLAVKIISDANISVYGLNNRRASTDAFLALPIDALGKEYYAISYEVGPGGKLSHALVVAAYDGTTINITPNGYRINGSDAPFSIHLNAGDTYLMESYSQDITGIGVVGDKPFGFLSGSECTFIPSIARACDHLVEMIPPVSNWGTKFISIPLATRLRGDIYRVLASEDDTQIIINGTYLATINSGEYFESELIPDNVVIETSQPSLVTQFSASFTVDHVTSDPFMMIVPPVRQYLDQYSFFSLGEVDGFKNAFLNIVVPTQGIESMQLDSFPINSNDFYSIGESGYSGAQLKLDPGYHKITGSDGFGISVYGFGDADSYGYPGGMNFNLINSNGDPYQPNNNLVFSGGYIFGYATDSEDTNANSTLDPGEDLNSNSILDQRTEDVNGNGRLDEGEDANNNGTLDRDAGIFRIELSDSSENLSLDPGGFIPGSLSVDYVITRTDPSLPASGTLIVTDGAGNTVETPIDFLAEPTLSQVSVVSTFSNQDIELVEGSFSKEPVRIEDIGNSTEVEWTFDQFPTDSVERLTYDLLMRNPTPGETRLILHDLKLSYSDVNGNPVVVSLGSKAVTVAPSVLTLSTSVDKANYLSNEDVHISHHISNLADFDDDAVLKVRVEDSTGTTVDSFVDSPVFITAGSSLSMNEMSYNIGNTITGDYKIIAELINNKGDVVRSSQATFSVVTASGGYVDLASSVVAEQSGYGAWDTVRLNSKLQNMASNSAVSDVTAEITVRAPDGQLIFSEQKPISSISALAVQQFYFNIPLAGAVEGQYQIIWIAKSADTGELLTTSMGQFSVEKVPEQDLVGTVTSDASRVFHTAENQCHFNLLNRGSLPLDAMPIAKSIVHIDSEQLISRDELIIDFAEGGEQQTSSSFNASQKPYGGYACILEANIDGAWQVLASAIFEVQAPLISTTASSGNQERLLVLTDAPRQCSAFEDIRLGSEFGAELSLNNEITVRLLNDEGVVLDTEVITAFDLNINQSYGTPTEPDLAVKASASGELEFILTKSGGMPHNRYQVEVKVKKSWLTTVEKSWSVDSSCDRPLTVGELYEDLTLIDWDIWSNDSDFREIDPYGPTAGPDLNTQNDFIKDLLDTAGWEYTLVHTPEDFAYEHRTGDYGSYLILSERPQLHWKVQKEIREAVVSGKGLLVAGAYDKRNHWLEPALGMDVIGHHPWARALNTNGELFTQASEVPLAFDDRVQGIWLDGASVIGEYTLAADQSEGWTWLDQHSFVLDDILSFKRKAITQYEYGDGRSLFFGFDLLLEASAGGSQSAYSNLLRESIDWIQPTLSEEPYPGSVLPVDITWTNNRGAVDAYTELSASGGATIVDADDFAMDATPIAATFSMGEGEVRDQTVYVELSSEPTQQLRVATTTVDGDQRMVQAEALLDLNTTVRPSLESTQAELDSLAWQYWYRVDYRSAWLKYKLARSAYEAGYYNEAQGLFLIAADLLMDSDEPDVIATRKSLYSHIETTGRQLALGQ